MTARYRAHRAFANAAMQALVGTPGIPTCYGQDLGAPADGGPCGVLCHRVTDAIEIAMATALEDAGTAIAQFARSIESAR